MVKLNGINQKECVIKIMKLIQFNINVLKVTIMSCIGPYEMLHFFSPYVLLLPNFVF